MNFRSFNHTHIENPDIATGNSCQVESRNHFRFKLYLVPYEILLTFSTNF